MTETLDELLDDLFHGAAFAAYVELAVACQGVPDSEATRRLAFRYFEEGLAAKQGRPRPVPTSTQNDERSGLASPFSSRISDTTSL